MRSQFTALGACLVVWVSAHCAAAQPTELFECFGHTLPACSDVAGGLFTDFDCFQYHYEGYRGRVAWLPLRYVGPVTLEIWARSVPGTRFPLYFEILPLQGRDPSLGYCDGPGEVLVAAQGRNDCGSGTYGPFHLELWGVELGASYVVRAAWVGDNALNYESPFLACVRVRPAASLVSSSGWGFVKRLYR